MNNLDAVFLDIEDFFQTFLPAWEDYLISSGVKQRNKPSLLSVSKVMTIVIAFHQSMVWRLKNLLHPLYLSLPHQRIS
ncbi:hypothetical protein BTN49_1609 [Candidatus Enterovibrio escicola]|uniref:Mobile element protein n=1 Tax=Candidatus Enterovibrio escicola TaxID=1927127 RepID=A0A2A5T3C2_9GAMM|nr:hypothetical protein [Candidatus Enterovibrio escacola]PCS22657.1 hypothetical protein BTN49_1609 [Candidatus Enterovibrio escacola]